MDRIVTMDRPVLVPGPRRPLTPRGPLAGLPEEIRRQEREDDGRGFEDEPEARVRLVRPAVMGPCPACQGHGGRTLSERRNGVRRVWWERCEDCKGSGRR